VDWWARVQRCPAQRAGLGYFDQLVQCEFDSTSGFVIEDDLGGAGELDGGAGRRPDEEGVDSDDNHRLIEQEDRVKAARHHAAKRN